MTIEHVVEPSRYSQAIGAAEIARSSAPLGPAYTPSSAVHTNIRMTLERHNARPAIGRMATDVNAHATALPMAISSPTYRSGGPHATVNNPIQPLPEHVDAVEASVAQ